MSYTLKPEKPFSETFRSVAVSQLEDAVKILKHQPKGLHEAVHDARKKFKRVRGLYRLVRPGAKEFSRAENTRIRDMAASISAERDATALLECVDRLREKNPSPKADMALAHLETALQKRRSGTAAPDGQLQEKVKAAIQTCHAAIDAAASHHFDDDDRPAAKIIAKGWKKTLSDAQVALMTAQATGMDEDFHELRKRSQNYWMYCALVSDVWPSAMKAKRKDAKSLADVLGNEHDLSVLIALLESEEKLMLSAEDRALSCKVAVSTRKRLRKQAIRSARRIFTDEAKDEAIIIRKLWRNTAEN